MAAKTYSCPKCKRAVTVYIGKTAPICTKCGKSMVPGKTKGKTA